MPCAISGARSRSTGPRQQPLPAGVLTGAVTPSSTRTFRQFGCEPASGAAETSRTQGGSR
ncbi:hypothetical protein ACWEPC_09910 [Nonomuraea sp. NPDC004297]